MLKSDKVFLRAVEPDDLLVLLNWENTTDYWDISHTLAPFSETVLKHYVQSAQDIYAVRQVRLIICENESQKPVGAVDLFDFEPRHQRASIGILIDPKYRNKKYAASAIDLVKQYALEIIGIRNLFACMIETNLPSIALFEKTGFVRSGCRKQCFNKNQRWYDEYIYQCSLV